MERSEEWKSRMSSLKRRFLEGEDVHLEMRAMLQEGVVPKTRPPRAPRVVSQETRLKIREYWRLRKIRRGDPDAG